LEIAQAIDPPTDDRYREIAERVEHALRHAVDLIDGSDPALITASMLNRPLPAAQSIEAQLLAYRDSGDGNNLDNANTAVDQLLDALRSLPGQTKPGSRAEAAQARKAIHAVEQSALDARQRMATLVNDLQNDIAATRGDLAQVQADQVNASAAIGDNIESLTAALTGQMAELGATIDQQKARLDQAISDYQAQFSAAQEERLRIFGEDREEQIAQFKERRDAADAASAAALEDRLGSADEIIGTIAELRRQAAKATEAIGIAGLAEGFRKDADEQRSTANWLRTLALVSLALVAGFALWAASARHNDKIDYGLLAARFAVSIALASVATYAIIQSAHHRERERHARKLELELASIDPYLAQMPEAEQIAIKAKLAEAWFGRPLAPIEESGGAGAASIPMSEFIQAIIKLGSK
jgi:hypothetical protein